VSDADGRPARVPKGETELIVDILSPTILTSILDLSSVLLSLSEPTIDHSQDASGIRR
jgi:hypothetical protein